MTDPRSFNQRRRSKWSLVVPPPSPPPTGHHHKFHTEGRYRGLPRLVCRCGLVLVPKGLPRLPLASGPCDACFFMDAVEPCPRCGRPLCRDCLGSHLCRK